MVADLMPASSPSLSSIQSMLCCLVFRPAEIHAQQHLGPVLALGAAGTGVDLEEAVEAIGLAREQALELQPGGGDLQMTCRSASTSSSVAWYRPSASASSASSRLSASFCSMPC